MAARWENMHAQLAGPAAAASATRRSAGARGHAQGHAFEEALDHLHIRYRAAMRAYVTKTPSPYRVLGVPKGGRFSGVFEGEGPPDYFAVIGGRAVVFDAKQTAADRWGFSALAQHQAEHFEEVTLQGGYAFALLWLGGVVRVVPWSALGPRWWSWWGTTGTARPGTASLSVADLDAIGHRCVGCDWLPVVVRLLGAP